MASSWVPISLHDFLQFILLIIFNVASFLLGYIVASGMAVVQWFRGSLSPFASYDTSNHNEGALMDSIDGLPTQETGNTNYSVTMSLHHDEQAPGLESPSSTTTNASTTPPLSPRESPPPSPDQHGFHNHDHDFSHMGTGL
jgi:hypothetical protein